MYISINWIKDFVDLEGIDIDNLINRFTLATAEVEGIEKKGFDTNGVVIGKVVDVKKHPNSDKLKITMVDIGDKKIQSLCGAPNVEVGMVIPFAPVGATVCGMEVKETNIAGELSQGVCLSEKELGISDDHSGLMILDNDLKLGTDIKEIIDMEDVVFEVDNKSLTHRPDLWGHYGIAREIAALVDRPLKPLEVENLELYSNLPKLDVKVEDTEKCFRYTSIAIENISKKVSPINMRVRLYYTGTRAINLLADITNYIMLELGQPMHAFDKALVDHVNITTLGKQQTFKTLDGIDRTIYEDTLMICKDNTPVCIAGIMGGENTQISDSTNSLFLESATFDSTSVRKSAIKIGLRTDASARYEKTLDPEMTSIAIARYVKLLKQSDSEIKVVSSLTDVYCKKYDVKHIEITSEYINRLIGIEISVTQMEKILTSLGFKVQINGNTLNVEVPSWRGTKDVSIKADLVEEISRIYGYDNIEAKTTIMPLQIVKTEEVQTNDYIIKDLLSQKYGLSEVHSYIWYDKKLNNQLKIQTHDNIKTINSLNADNNVLRYSMAPTLLNMLDNNMKYFNDVNIFEIGKVFEYNFDGKECGEHKNLGIVLASKNLSEEQLLSKAVTIANSVCNMTKNINPKYTVIEEVKHNWMSIINSANIEYNNEVIGYISSLDIRIKDTIDKKMNCAIIEIELDKLNKIEKIDKVYKEISKYQTVKLDLSLIVDSNLNYSKIEEYIASCKTENMIDYQLVEIYEDKEKLGDKKSVTIKFTFGSNDHTLTNEEIISSQQALIEHFEKNNVIIRK